MEALARAEEAELKQNIADIEQWWASPRFKHTTGRPYSAAQVASLRGTIGEVRSLRPPPVPTRIHHQAHAPR